MTTNLLSVIEQLVLDAEILLSNIRRDAPQLSGRAMGRMEAAIAAGKQALEQTQGEDDYKRGFADGMKEAPTGEYWIRAIDEAMVGAHLGVADMADDYGTAKKKLNDLICWSVQVDRDLSHPQAIEPQALEQTQGEAARPDILEKLTYHRFERDDMTLDDCLTYLRTNGWHEVHGRTERQMILQLTELLASAPAHPQATESAPVGFNGLTQAETEATMSVRGLSEPAPSTAGERAATLERFERLAHRKGELWERCQGKGWPDAESGEFTGLRDEKLPALRAALLSAPALPPESGNLCVNCAADGKCMKRQALCHANGTAMPVGEPLTGAHYFAMREAYQVAAADQYFVARLQIDTSDRRRVYEAGFNRGFEDGAAHGITKKGVEP